MPYGVTRRQWVKSPFYIRYQSFQYIYMHHSRHWKIFDRYWIKKKIDDEENKFKQIIVSVMVLHFHLQVEHCRMPGLAVALTLHHAQQIQSEDAQTVGISDVVSFVSGLLLGSDVNNRTWFAQFIRHGQKARIILLIFLLGFLWFWHLFSFRYTNKIAKFHVTDPLCLWFVYTKGQ